MTTADVARNGKHVADLEMLLAMLVAKYGEPVPGGGYRIVINAEDAFALRRKVGSADPLLMHTFEPIELQYVVDVL